MTGGAVVHRDLPAVPFFTLPPDLLRAAERNGFGGEGKIGLSVPLGQQSCKVLPMAKGR